MAMRTCAKCQAAENPLGRLRFKKNPQDRKVYCENCDPGSFSGQSSPPPSPLPGTSAGSLVVIPCPDCRGMGPGLHGKECKGCSGYGSVRVAANFLNVYKPGQAKPLTGG